MEATTTQTLHEAVSALADRNADWASEQNSVGYNKSDSWLGASLASVPESQWTPEMRYTAWVMLRKYKRQLLNYGIDYDLIPVPPTPTTDDDSDARRVARAQTYEIKGQQRAKDEGRVERTDGGFKVHFPYDANMVAAVKEIPGRRFDGKDKSWFIPETDEGVIGLGAFVERTGIRPVDAELAEYLAMFADEAATRPKLPDRRVEVDKPGTVRVLFPYDGDLVSGIKTTGVAKFDRDRKLWTVKLTEQSAAALGAFAAKYDFHVADDVKDELGRAVEKADMLRVASTAQDADIVVDDLGAILRPFQRGGVRYLTEVKRGFIGDEMGLGKTPQSLATVQREQAYPAIAVVPNLAKRNWLREVDFWLPGRSVTILDTQRKQVTIKRIVLRTLSATDPEKYPNLRAEYEAMLAETDDDALAARLRFMLDADDERLANRERVIQTNDLSADIVIVNYDIIARKPGGRLGAAIAERKPKMFASLAEALVNVVKPLAVILDESHYIKSPKAKRTLAALLLGKSVEYRFLLTGTPILNRPVELVAQLDMIDMLQAFGGFWGFAKRYCAMYHDGRHYDFSGASNLEELNRRLRETCYVRREKKDVMPELPPVQRQSIELPLTDRKAYQAVQDDVLAWVRKRAENDRDFLAEIAELDKEEQQAAIKAHATSAEARAARAEILVQLNALRFVAAQQKLDAIVDWVRQWMDDNPDEKMILFAWHVPIQKALLDAFPNAARIYAEDAPAKRTQNEHRFQEDDDCRLLVASINASGVSLTLTAASAVAFTELPWRPGDIDQCEGRAYGRLNDAHGINSYYLLGEDTIDGDMGELIDAKRVVVDKATSGKAGASGTGIVAALVGRLLKLDDMADAA